MHGRGQYTWADGRSYEGHYQDDKKHGYGEYIWCDGRKYMGEWQNGKQHGTGYLILPNGEIKKVRYEEGQKQEYIDMTEEERDLMVTQIKEKKQETTRVEREKKRVARD